MQYINGIELEDIIVNHEKEFQIAYCWKLKIFVMAVNIQWKVWYNRYYQISEDDYKLYQTDPDAFMKNMKES